MRIYDCFMFNNELDVLEIRLHELAPVVSRFVLVEAEETHSGQPKPLHFELNKERFRPFLDRITHVRLRRLPPTDDAWQRENAQRQAILDGLPDLADDDVVMVSDVDEVPRAASVAHAAGLTDAWLVGLRLTYFCLRLNYLQLEGIDPNYVWSVIARGATVRQRGPQWMRNARIDLERRFRAGTLPGHAVVLPHAGWHFSYMGDAAHVALKLRSFAHREFADASVLERRSVEDLLAGGHDLLDRVGYRWVLVALNDFHPAYVLANRQKFSHLIAEGARYEIDWARTRENRQVVAVRIDRGEPDAPGPTRAQTDGSAG